MLSSSNLGFYGKLPWMGDFISSNIEFNQQQCIDHWLSSGMFKLRDDSSDWLNAYLYAPVWSFFLPSGIWSDVPVCGLIMPSVDRVGRYFPFVLFFKLNNEPDLFACCVQLSVVAKILPELLEQEISKDEISRFIERELHKTNTHGADTELTQGDSDLLVELLSSGGCCWWIPDGGAGFHFISDIDVDLFFYLFSSSEQCIS